MTDREHEAPGLTATLQQPFMRLRRCSHTVKRHGRKQVQPTYTQHDVKQCHKEMRYDERQEYKNTSSYETPTKQTHRTARQCNFVVVQCIKNETALMCEHNTVTVIISRGRKPKVERAAFCRRLTLGQKNMAITAKTEQLSVASTLKPK